jgi:hypothetical protein
MMVMCEHINEAYHKKADIFSAAILTVMTIIFLGRFLHLKVNTL